MNDQTSQLPVRKPQQHTPPFSVPARQAIFFVTVCAADRARSPFVGKEEAVLSSARFYQAHRAWFLHLLLVMPDHLHLLVQALASHSLAQQIRTWKRYLSRVHGLAFQKDFWETRIRDAAHFAEKWNYILYNPVRRGLVAIPRNWPHVLSFVPETGEERPHRGPAPTR